jgi:hypothetical protein
MSHLFASKIYKSTYTPIQSITSIEVHLDLGLLFMAFLIIVTLVKTLLLSSFLPPSPNPTLNYLLLPCMTDKAPTLDKRAVAF